MAFIPKNAEWYIAQIVLEITVSGDDRNVVHVNYMLINASSPEEAHSKALRLGAEHESEYSNPERKSVHIRFAGLRNLNVVYEKLEDGAELLYEEQVNVSPQRLATLIREKEAFGVFKPIAESAGPNYASREIRDEALKLVGGQRATGENST